MDQTPLLENATPPSINKYAECLISGHSAYNSVGWHETNNTRQRSLLPSVPCLQHSALRTISAVYIYAMYTQQPTLGKYKSHGKPPWEENVSSRHSNLPHGLPDTGTTVCTVGRCMPSVPATDTRQNIGAKFFPSFAGCRLNLCRVFYTRTLGIYVG